MRGRIPGASGSIVPARLVVRKVRDVRFIHERARVWLRHPLRMHTDVLVVPTPVRDPVGCLGHPMATRNRIIISYRESEAVRLHARYRLSMRESFRRRDGTLGTLLFLCDIRTRGMEGRNPCPLFLRGASRLSITNIHEVTLFSFQEHLSRDLPTPEPTQGHGKESETD